MNNRKVILITGSTSGIGLAGAKELAKKGFDIIGIGRNEEKCFNAIKEIRQQNKDVKIRYFTADLSLQSDVKSVCIEIQEYLEQNYQGKLDCLINNAGVFTTYYTLTKEGFEMQFAVNHLAHFLMTKLMMPCLLKAENPRVLTTSSSSHYGAKIDFDDIMLCNNYSQLAAYKRTKLMNVLFTAELNRRYGKNSSFKAYAVDPALVNTSMGEKQTSGLAKFIWSIRRNSGVTPKEGAKTMIYLASEREIENGEDFYYKHSKAKKPNKRGLDKASAKRLWSISEKYCGTLEVG